MGEQEGEDISRGVEAMYRDKGEDLLRVARKLLTEKGISASRLSAEDLVQDALAVLLVNVGEKRLKVEKLDGYVYVVMRNKVRDEARRRGTADPVDLTAYQVESRMRPLHVSEVTEDVDARLDVRAALDGLSPQQRRLVMLAKGFEYTHAELAELTSLSTGTVSRHVSRAVQVLTGTLGTVLTALGVAFSPTLASGVVRELVDAASDGGSLDAVSPGDFVSIATILLAAATAFILRNVVPPRRRRVLREEQVRREATLVSSELERELGRRPTVAEISEALDVPEEWVLGALDPLEEPGVPLSPRPQGGYGTR
ncbi:sigma-70 family RNA polymerase sigma factor [Streptomyces liangshanensis]|uniref:Sigma-70 family RNA polymerase sigma factor n=1 Tax=Streptomyces liangshanensis TaxID=2717324 RepID=A0A6G9H5R2_9ACTN|nr:sigma-70 family RNA polymerase sigma factor [Streptomyces liangshanensis]QIQ05888.1 sigma-70 family RNA polymerase sigma factor [Streptomyces liangshanensis]